MSLVEGGGTVIVECPHCNARVEMQVIATFDHPEEWHYSLENLTDEPPEGADPVGGPRERWTLLACRICAQIILACQEDQEWDGSWSALSRVYPPERDVTLPVEFPQGIRRSLTQARLCFGSGAYDATATMCRRVVEGLCREYHPSGRLEAALKELKNREIIDGMLLRWADAVRLYGNIGAHPDPTTISKEDAEDLLDFAFAICQYVFVLGEKFRKFTARTSPGGQGATTVQ